MASFRDIRDMNTAALETEARGAREITVVRKFRVDPSGTTIQLYIANGGPHDGELCLRATVGLEAAYDGPAAAVLPDELVTAGEEILRRGFLATHAEPDPEPVDATVAKRVRRVAAAAKPKRGARR